MTAAPSLPRFFAIPLPMPFEAPVTSATFPVSLLISSSPSSARIWGNPVQITIIYLSAGFLFQKVKMRKPRKPQERTAITRNLLLVAAERIFAYRGYEKAQLEEIAQASGFSKGALYAHFKSKEELFLALAKTKAAGYQTKLRLALDNAPTRET